MQNPIPLSIIRDLKCGHCNRFVNCGPVHVTPDSSILCGRCLRFAKRTYRNYSYEAIASNYTYPCHFWSKHCNKSLEWQESLDHERYCLFKNKCNVFCARPLTLMKSERKLPDGFGDMRFEDVNEETLEKLKCASCESYLSNFPVYIISDGRNICHRCIHSNGIPNDAIRNLAYETLASTIIFPCIYRFRGCTFRMRFGREMWEHEHQCSYGQIKRLSKKPSKGGKERGVIETHSGHIWGTITPHSALFAPPKTKKNEGKYVTQELEIVMKKKKEDEFKNLEDSQSVDSIVSKGTFDSLGDNNSRSSPKPLPPYVERYDSFEENGPSTSYPKVLKRTADNISLTSDAIPSTPTSPMPFNGYYQQNMIIYGRQISCASNSPAPHPNGDLRYSSSINYIPRPVPSQIPVKKSESFRVGNPDLIHELKQRQIKRNSTRKNENPYKKCNNLHDIVQTHDEVFVIN